MTYDGQGIKNESLYTFEGNTTLAARDRDV
jgi:hypothetical protein